MLWFDLSLDSHFLDFIDLLKNYCNKVEKHGSILNGGPQNNYLAVNDKFLEISGHSRDFIYTSKNYYKIFAKERVHEDDVSMYIEETESEARIINFRLIDNNGNIRNYRIVRYSIYSLSHFISLSIFMDLTEE
ncbi:MAG: hypothetical protein GY756_04990 [bacterium]|nr:hypothetical protein [bacterium]